VLLSDWLDNDWSLLPSEVVGLLLGYPIEATLGTVSSGTDSESCENEDEDSEGEEKSGEECELEGEEVA